MSPLKLKLHILYVGSGIWKLTNAYSFPLYKVTLYKYDYKYTYKSNQLCISMDTFWGICYVEIVTSLQYLWIMVFVIEKYSMCRERERDPCDPTPRRPDERLVRKQGAQQPRRAERHRAAGACANPPHAHSHKCGERVLSEWTCWGKSCYSESDKYLLYEAE